MATITEDYVSFETAKLLKEKGFTENCLMRYNKVGDLVEEAYKFNWNFQTIDYSSPTLQMTMKWLREVHNVHICVQPLVECGYTAYIYDIADKDDYGIIQGIPHHNSYEQAVEAAIKYCLKNLI